MKFKLHILCVSLLILSLSISAVSATEVNGTFTDLQNIINNDDTGSISLDRNYSYTISDSDYKNGVNINKTLNINGNGFYINGNDGARIFNIISNNVIISNINFINGNCSVGGAILVNGTNCSINNCYFTGNNATKGGSIFVTATGCSVTESLFESNHGKYGIIRCEGNNFSLCNCNFINNSVDQCGAGLWIKASNSTVLNSNFINGTAIFTGGGITFSEGDKLLIDNCSFINNGIPQYGGALLLRGTNALANNCVFYNNQAILGGAIQSSGANNTVVNSIFDGNSALNGQSVAYKLSTNFSANENYWAMNYDSKDDFIDSDLLSYYYKPEGVHTDVSTAPENWILMNINPLNNAVAGKPVNFEVAFDTLTNGVIVENYKANLPNYKTIICFGDESFELTIPQSGNAIFSLTFEDVGENLVIVMSPFSYNIEAYSLVNVSESGNDSDNANISTGKSINTLPNTGNPFLVLLLALVCLPLIRRDF